MKKEIVTFSEMEAVTPVESEKQAIVAMKALLDTPFDEEAQNAVRRSADAIHALHRRLEEYSAAREALKAVIEDTLCIVDLPDHFKWQKGAVTRKVSDMAEFAKIAEGNGLTLADLLPYCSITAKNAAKAIGQSDEAFAEHFGSVIEEKQNKPTLKRVF